MSHKSIVQILNDFNLSGFSLLQDQETNRITYYLLVNQYYEPFKRARAFKQIALEDSGNSEFLFVEFIGQVTETDIKTNSYLLRELIDVGLKYIMFIGADDICVVNAVASNKLDALYEVKKQYFLKSNEMNDNPYVRDLLELQEELYYSLCGH